MLTLQELRRRAKSLFKPEPGAFGQVTQGQLWGLTFSRRAIANTIRVGLRSSIGKNILSLYTIQFANYIIPLIMVPYLVRVLGPAGYGAVAFAQGFINYLRLFVEYGFDWSATRRISVLRGNKRAVNHIAVHVWSAKGLLSLIGFSILGLLVLTVPKLREVTLLLLALYGLIFGNALFPTWLFQGMERMVAISVINLGMKLSILAGVFLLVKQPQDALVYAGLMGGGSVLAGLAGAVVAFRMFGLRLMRVSLQGVWEVLKEGWMIFISKASLSVYVMGNAFILGMLTNHTVVGYYAAAERIVMAILGMMYPLSQAVYPRFSKLASISEESLLLWARYLLLAMSAVGIIITVGLWLAAPDIVSIFFGDKFLASVHVLRILSVLCFIERVVNVWGMQIMLPFGYDKEFFLVHLVGGVINISLAIPLVLAFSERGMALSVVLSWTSMLFTESFMLFFRVGVTPWLTFIKPSKQEVDS